MLSNHEFLSMAELKFNPFRPRLQVALPMKSEDYIRSVGNEKDAESFEKQTIDPNIIQSSNKVAPEAEADDVKEIDLIAYIDFGLFCQYLSVFSPRATNDTKIRCKGYAVLFKLFDMDGDDLLSRDDLTNSLKIIVAGNLKPEELSETVDHIFAENGKEGLDNLTKEDLQKSLWMTDFHQKLSLYFGP